jgi:uncharacterized phage infection (PIP) family protein YhgE
VGLFTKLGSAFTRSSKRPAGRPTATPPAARPSSSAEAKPTRAPAPNGSATLTNGLHAARNGVANGSEAAADAANGSTATAVMPRRPEATTSPTAPRNKQELLEELQKNYREVVELVRKVDVHLDRDETRSQEFVSIARRVDETLPSLENAPERLNDAIQTLSERVTDAIRNASSIGDKRVARLEQALTRISDTIDAQGAAQHELTHTMASFRETLGDIAATSERTGSVLEHIEKRQAERESETARLLSSSRNWLLASLAISVGVASAAMAIAIVAMVNAG